MSEKKSGTDQLLTHLKGLVKQYLIHDAQNRIIASYTAPIDAVVGSPCVLTKYVYRGVATTQIRMRIEQNAIWDEDNQGWDSLDVTLPDPLIDPNLI